MWKGSREIVLLLVIVILFTNGCYSTSFKRQVFFTEYFPQNIPKQIPNWWRVNLSQYLRLSYIENGDESAFGGLGNDVFSPNLYSTYAAVGILDNLSSPIEDSKSVIKWIQSLQDKKGVFYDKSTLAQPIEQTYWAISTLQKLNFSPPNFQNLLQFLKNYEQNNGLFIFSNTAGKESVETGISQTYFVISILRLLKIKPKIASKIFNFKTLAKTLQIYIRDHASTNVALNDLRSGYLISAIFELSYIDVDLMPSVSYEWLSSKILEIDTLPYGVQYISLVNNLTEALDSLKINSKDVAIRISTYLEQKVLPNQNTSGGFGFGKNDWNFIEPMVTYEAIKLFKASNISYYPNIDKLIENLKAHRVKNGWIKFITFEPSVQATYYAVLLAKENGDIKKYPIKKLEKYLEGTIGDLAKSITTSKNSNGIRTVKISDISEKLKKLYYAVATYNLLEKHIPTKLRTQVINLEKTLIKELPPSSEKSDILVSAEAFSYFIHTFNILQIWPSDSFGLLNEIREITNRLAYTIKDEQAFNMKTLFEFYILNSVIRFYDLHEGNENSFIIENALSILNTGNGFKMSPQLNIPDVHSTYLGLWLIGNISGNLTTLNTDEVIKFVMASQAEYGFYYVPQRSDSGSDLRVTYEALWIIDFITVGKDYNFSLQR